MAGRGERGRKLGGLAAVFTSSLEQNFFN